MKKIFIAILILASFASTAQAQEEMPNYSNQANNVIKFSFLPPLFGSTSFSYERAISHKMSYEIEAGIIGFAFGKGVHYDNLSNKRPVGGSLAFGWKFHTSSNNYHLLAGTYLKPEIAVSFFRKYEAREYGYYYTSRTIYHKDVTAVALMITFGKEVIFKNNLSIDWFVSFGYGYSNEDEFDFNYNFVGGASDVPIAFSTGFKIGYAFGKYKK